MELKHLKTFEQYSVNDTDVLNEEIKSIKDLVDMISGVKTNIKHFLDDPKDEEKANKLLKSAFFATFKKNKKLEKEILDLELNKKVDLLKDALNKLDDPKIDIIKVFKKSDGTYEVGGQSKEGVKGLMSLMG